MSKSLTSYGSETFSTADDSPVPDTLESVLRPMVIDAVQHRGGVPYLAVLASVVQSTTMSIDVGVLTSRLLGVVGEMAERGEITRLEYTAENTTSVDIYPKDTSFTVTPPGSFRTGASVPLPVLDPAQARASRNLVEMTRSLGQSLGWPVVAHAVAAFCPRCGVPSHGHVCK